MFFSQITLAAASLALVNAQGYVASGCFIFPARMRSNVPSNNGQYTSWTPTTTEAWVPETTTSNYWTPTTSSEYWTTPYTTPYAWTSYTTVTSCYTENGLVITVTTWVPCPCGGYASTVTSNNLVVGTTTETLITTTTPAYSTFTSNGIVYVVPLSTPVTATASAGLQIVSSSDASKSTEIEGWVGVLSAVVLGGFAVIAVVL